MRRVQYSIYNIIKYFTEYIVLLFPLWIYLFPYLFIMFCCTATKKQNKKNTESNVPLAWINDGNISSVQSV